MYTQQKATQHPVHATLNAASPASLMLCLESRPRCSTSQLSRSGTAREPLSCSPALLRDAEDGLPLGTGGGGRARAEDASRGSWEDGGGEEYDMCVENTIRVCREEQNVCEQRRGASPDKRVDTKCTASVFSSTPHCHSNPHTLRRLLRWLTNPEPSVERGGGWEVRASCSSLEASATTDDHCLAGADGPESISQGLD